MATSGTIIERFASGGGYLPSTVERMLRPLRAAGLVPMGEKGRGQRVGHYDASHLTNLILACGGVQPADSAEAASVLGELPFLTFWNSYFASEQVQNGSTDVNEDIKKLWPVPEPNKRFDGFYMPKRTVRQALEHIITGIAHVHKAYSYKAETASSAHDFLCQLVPSTIELTLSPLMVRMHWHKDNNISRTDIYIYSTLSPSPQELNSKILQSTSVRRTIYINAGLIHLAGELLYNNPSWKPTLPLPFLASAVPNAGQKDENTGPVPTSPAPDSDQAALLRDPDGVTRPEHGGVREKSQSSRQRGRGTQPVIRRENRHADTQDSAYLPAP